MYLVEKTGQGPSLPSSQKEESPGVFQGSYRNTKFLTHLLLTETFVYFLITHLLDFTRNPNLRANKKSAGGEGSKS